MDPDIEMKVKTAVSELDSDLAVSLGDLENADYILAVGVDPVNEAPMLTMAMRQAQRKGAKVVLADPRSIGLPFDFNHLPMVPDAMDLWLYLLLKNMVESGTAQSFEAKASKSLDGTMSEDITRLWNPDQMEEVARGLVQSLRPVIVCGTEIVPETVPGLAADCARYLKFMKKSSGLFYLFTGANAFGAALLSEQGMARLAALHLPTNCLKTGTQSTATSVNISRTTNRNNDAYSRP